MLIFINVRNVTIIQEKLKRRNRMESLKNKLTEEEAKELTKSYVIDNGEDLGWVPNIALYDYWKEKGYIKENYQNNSNKFALLRFLQELCSQDILPDDFFLKKRYVL